MKSLVIKLFGTKKYKKTFNFYEIKSILFKPIGDAIGDAVVHISHLEQLKKALPNVKIAVLVTERNRQIFSHAPSVDMILEDTIFTYISQRSQWDLYLDFRPSFTTRGIILDKILNPTFLINFGKKAKKAYTLETVKNYDFSTQIPNAVHFADYLTYSIFGKHLSSEKSLYNLALPHGEYDEVINAWHMNKTIKILLNPQGSMRQIPPLELSKLLSLIDSKYTKQISFLLTNTKESATYLAELDPNIDIKLAPKTDILGYCALVNSADIVIAVDGGGVHIACAFGKKLLSFYANHSENIARWYPRPKQDIETLMIVANQETDDNNNTMGFSLTEPANWLNNQLAKLMRKSTA